MAGLVGLADANEFLKKAGKVALLGDRLCYAVVNTTFYQSRSVPTKLRASP